MCHLPHVGNKICHHLKFNSSMLEEGFITSFWASVNRTLELVANKMRAFPIMRLKCKPPLNSPDSKLGLLIIKGVRASVQKFKPQNVENVSLKAI